MGTGGRKKPTPRKKGAARKGAPSKGGASKGGARKARPPRRTEPDGRIPRWAWTLPVVAAGELALLVIGLIAATGTGTKVSGIAPSPTVAPTPAATIAIETPSPTPAATATPQATVTPTPQATATPSPTASPSAAPVVGVYRTVVLDRTVGGGTATSSATVACPSGYVAVGGGAKNLPQGSKPAVIVASGPLFGGGDDTLDVSDGDHGAPLGWAVTVRNWSGNSSRSYSLGAVCARGLSGVITRVDSASVGAGGSDGTIDNAMVTCPSGKVALGGGVTNEERSSPSVVVSSAPLFAGKTLATVPTGEHAAPTGWDGTVFNPADASQRTYKVAVVCVEAPSGARAVVRTDTVPGGGGTGSKDSSHVNCPVGSVAAGGGLKNSEEEKPPLVASSAPFFATGPIDELTGGDHPAPIGWDVTVDNPPNAHARGYELAVVCIER